MKQIFGTFPINDRYQIWVGIEEQFGREKLDIRLYYLDKRADEYRPSPKGVRIPRRLVVEVMQAMLNASRELMTHGPSLEEELVEKGADS